MYGGSCCLPVGASCSSQLGCCTSGATPARCNLQTGKCEVPTCVEASGPNSGQCIPGQRPCCDSRLACVDKGVLLGSMCCAPDGTILPQANATLCCSNSSHSNNDGTVTCKAL
jgi:hypothetical protein